MGEGERESVRVRGRLEGTRKRKTGRLWLIREDMRYQHGYQGTENVIRYQIKGN